MMVLKLRDDSVRTTVSYHVRIPCILVIYILKFTVISFHILCVSVNGLPFATTMGAIFTRLRSATRRNSWAQVCELPSVLAVRSRPVSRVGCWNPRV